VDFSDERKKMPDVPVVAGLSRQTPKSGEARDSDNARRSFDYAQLPRLRASGDCLVPEFAGFENFQNDLTPEILEF